MNAGALRYVDGRRARREPGVLQNLRRCVSILPSKISQQDMLASADSPRDGLPDRPGSDDDDDVAHTG